MVNKLIRTVSAPAMPKKVGDMADELIRTVSAMPKPTTETSHMPDADRAFYKLALQRKSVKLDETEADLKKLRDSVSEFTKVAQQYANPKGKPTARDKVFCTLIDVLAWVLSTYVAMVAASSIGLNWYADKQKNVIELKQHQRRWKQTFVNIVNGHSGITKVVTAALAIAGLWIASKPAKDFVLGLSYSSLQMPDVHEASWFDTALFGQFKFLYVANAISAALVILVFVLGFESRHDLYNAPKKVYCLNTQVRRSEMQ